MKLTIQKVLISIVLVLTYININAQAFRASYEYDANGNRTKAYVVYLTSSLKSATVSLDSLKVKADTSGLPKDGWSKGFSDPSNNFTATVYPNPAHGLLIVELSNTGSLNTNNNCIKVWNMQGSEVFHLINPTSTNNVDLSKLPYGSYILKISINGSVKDYKIIKN